LDDIPEEAMVIEYVIVLYSHYSFLTSFLCVIRGYRSRLDEEVDNARPNDPVMLGAQFELDLSTDPYQYTMDATESSNHFASNPNAPGQRVAAPMQSGGALSSNSDDLANESIVVSSMNTEAAGPHTELDILEPDIDRFHSDTPHLTSNSPMPTMTPMTPATPVTPAIGGDAGNQPGATMSSKQLSRSNVSTPKPPQAAGASGSNRSIASSDDSDSNSIYDIFTPSFDTSPWVSLLLYLIGFSFIANVIIVSTGP
jgi:hypothetical protein